MVPVQENMVPLSRLWSLYSRIVPVLQNTVPVQQNVVPVQQNLGPVPQVLVALVLQNLLSAILPICQLFQSLVNSLPEGPAAVGVALKIRRTPAGGAGRGGL